MTVPAPVDSQRKQQLIKEYRTYVQGIESTLEQAIRDRVLDGKLVRGIVQQVLDETGLKTEPINVTRTAKRSPAPSVH